MGSNHFKAKRCKYTFLIVFVIPISLPCKRRQHHQNICDWFLIFQTMFLLTLLMQGATLLMMGSADKLPDEPAQRVVFMEDMTDTELASAVS